eukprot:Clim_evm42s203 gene=Clim_evmTU42s203
MASNASVMRRARGLAKVGENGAHILYGSENSLYTGKARGYLKWKGIPFLEKQSTLDIYRSVILPKTGVSQIPVLACPDGSVVTDTTNIIDYVESAFPDIPSVYPDTPKQCLAALIIELFGDEFLKIHAMYYRWWFTEEHGANTTYEFGRIASGRPELREQMGAQQKEMFKGLLPVLGVQTKEMAQAVERHTHKLFGLIEDHLATHPFLLGLRPTLADFGMMGPLYAHLLRDPVSGFMIRRQYPRSADWIERCMGMTPSRVDEDRQQCLADYPELYDARTGLLVDDELTPQVTQLLGMFFRDHTPWLTKTRELLLAGMSSGEFKAGAKIPRVVGESEYVLDGVTGIRRFWPYELWLLHRVVDFYRTGTFRVMDKTYHHVGRPAVQASAPQSVLRPWIQQTYGNGAVTFLETVDWDATRVGMKGNKLHLQPGPAQPASARL